MTATTLDAYRYDDRYSVDRLIADQQRATEGWDGRRGAFGQALSLPAPDQIHPVRRHAYINYPYMNVLDDCPYFREISDGFECEMASFRLLCRGSGTAYAWHEDTRKGPGIARFQIPVVSAESARLLISDYTDVEQLRGDRNDLFDADSLAAFLAANEGRVRAHRLEVGRLHYFNSSQVHTLVNPPGADRITLLFDVVVNEWVLERYPEVRVEVGDAPGVSMPGPLRQTLRSRLARLYPLRTHAHRWVHGRHLPQATE